MMMIIMIMLVTTGKHSLSFYFRFHMSSFVCFPPDCVPQPHAREKGGKKEGVSAYVKFVSQDDR